MKDKDPESVDTAVGGEAERQPTPGMRGFGPFTVVAALGAVLLATLVLFIDVPVVFSNLLAILVFAAAVFDAVMMFRERHPVVASGFVVVAIITNPIIVFGFATVIWSMVFYAFALYFALVAFFIRGPGPDPDADVTPDKRFL